MRKLPKTLTEQEFLAKLKTVKKAKHKLAFMLGFYQCLRVSEVINLRPQDVDKARGFIHIIAGKGNKDRDIPIMQPLQRGFTHLPVNLTRQALHYATKRYYGKEIHFHTFRHSGATFYLNIKKVGIRQLQQLLGHSRLDTTQIYTHISPIDLKESFDEVWK